MTAAVIVAGFLAADLLLGICVGKLLKWRAP